RRSAPFAQPRGAFRVVPGEPFVASLSAHPVALTQLTHRVQVLFTIDDEPHPLVHGCRLRPRHALPPWESSLSGVTHVPGEIGYVCDRVVPATTPNPRLNRTAHSRLRRPWSAGYPQRSIVAARRAAL